MSFLQRRGLEFRGPQFFDFSEWRLLVISEFAMQVGWVVQGLKMKVKKHGVFQELFFVEHQWVKGDWAICNKRFVRRFRGGVIET